MKVAITATEPSLGARVDPQFGRCPYFLMVETDGASFEAVENPNVALGGGAGIQSAQLMAANGVQTVLTGNCGPNAYQTLSAAGIGVIVGCSGTVADVIEQFKAGELNASGQPNVAAKFGLGGASNPPEGPSFQSQQLPTADPGMGMGPGGGGGMGRGMGQGGGRGMGRGMGQGGGRGGGGGRGMGRGMGRGRGMGMGAGYGAVPVPTPQQPAQNLPKAQELAMLRQQAEAMSQQMQQIQERIRQLGAAGKGSMTATVDPEKCTGCALCVEVCPVEAIRLEAEVAVVNAQSCTGCGACVDECPNEAISMA